MTSMFSFPHELSRSRPCEAPLNRAVTYRYAPDLEIVDYHCDPVDALDWKYPD